MTATLLEESAGVYTDIIGPTIDTPRRKSCSGCAFRRHDPQGLQTDPEWGLLQDDWASGTVLFFCTHTTDEQGRHQLCAAFNALYIKGRPHERI